MRRMRTILAIISLFKMTFKQFMLFKNKFKNKLKRLACVRGQLKRDDE